MAANSEALVFALLVPAHRPKLYRKTQSTLSREDLSVDCGTVIVYSWTISMTLGHTGVTLTIEAREKHDRSVLGGEITEIEATRNHEMRRSQWQAPRGPPWTGPVQP